MKTFNAKMSLKIVLIARKYQFDGPLSFSDETSPLKDFFE
jgi:hypothetical protein